jgi:4-hydroxy-tetrahydrodipicolinate synthase
MKSKLFTGTCTALVTPFLDGQINFKMVEKLLTRQIDAGIRAVVLSGTTGESPTLSDTEKLELFRRAKSFVGDSCMIIAGTGSNSTARAVSLSIAAEAASADALLIVSPYYNKATPSGLVAHYTAIAESVSIPMILYNVPSRTGLDMPVSVYRKLSRIPKIAGVKEASVDVSKVTKTINECDKGFCVWSGNDDLAVPVISVGGQGLISVMSNICPVETNAMVEAALDGDFDTAASLHAQLQPLCELLFCEVNPIPVKAAMQYIGYDCGECRLPLCSLSGENRAKMEKFFS